MTDAPDASVKLRTVLDYVPCEACLAQPVKEQDLLCSICARLDRQVGVRISVRSTILVERPSEPGPVVIEPPAPPVPAPEPLDIVLARPGEALPEPRPGITQVVLEPLEPEPPVVAAEPEVEWDDVASWTAADDPFEYVRPLAAPPPPPPEPVPEDAFVFAPPPREPEPEPAPVEAREEAWMPVEEVVVEPEPAEAWAPPVPHEAQPEPPLEESTPWARPADPVEEPVLEATVVEDDVVEMEVLPDEPAAESEPGSTDLWKLRGFDRSSERGFRGAGVTEVIHLAGHDPHELGSRTGVPPERLVPWIQAADLVHEAGVPLESAIALVAAGVAGPRGLREMDAETVVERAQAFAGARIATQDVKRWKRRV